MKSKKEKELNMWRVLEELRKEDLKRMIGHRVVFRPILLRKADLADKVEILIELEKVGVIRLDEPSNGTKTTWLVKAGETFEETQKRIEMEKEKDEKEIKPDLSEFVSVGILKKFDEVYKEYESKFPEDVTRINGGRKVCLKIKKITFIERPTATDPVYTFYINEDATNSVLVRRDSTRIKKFIRLLKNEDIEYEKDLLDYINSNHNCALYRAGKYPLIKIIERHGQTFRVCSGIEARVITEIAHKKEQNKR